MWNKWVMNEGIHLDKYPLPSMDFPCSSRKLTFSPDPISSLGILWQFSPPCCLHHQNFLLKHLLNMKTCFPHSFSPILNKQENLVLFPHLYLATVIFSQTPWKCGVQLFPDSVFSFFPEPIFQPNFSPYHSNTSAPIGNASNLTIAESNLILDLT